ncbi:hypothetical protein CBI38_28960 [Rhodococcus oxybenzonivorans]|uniref:Uncharacterized protein n=1 Tax=Rhodococcus oxybenzonivorans TaxID=1990687 RepID=A0A2S2C291_9NOCA|nr:hypothetical protein [Rhodococcus oxybenzonivorans]AWK74990.1 hypothetical protein CBI38_28960 [Rhodococcus oxybenzonivorans]
MQLDGNADLDAVLASIAAWSEQLDEDAWVVGGRWGSHLLDEVASLDASTGWALQPAVER